MKRLAYAALALVVVVSRGRCLTPQSATNLASATRTATMIIPPNRR